MYGYVCAHVSTVADKQAKKGDFKIRETHDKPEENDQGLCPAKV